MDNGSKTFLAAVGIGALLGLIPVLLADGIPADWGYLAFIVVTAIAYWKIRDNER